MITLIDAVKMANELVRKNTGIECDPDMVQRVEQQGADFWWIVYNSSHFFREQFGEGPVIVDGGEYIIRVDCQSGETTVAG